ncbi:MAG: galactose mutarotase [Muribaculaceae bacterium]|nr:galactose mutarotase [Muribaculaceae bacterium]
MLFICCSKQKRDGLTLSGLDPLNFTEIMNGDTVKLAIMRNSHGMEVCISNYGARIISIVIPDKKGENKNVVLGFDSIQSYYPEEDLPKLGGTIGRYAGRIGNAQFILDGDTIKVTANNFGHCLHGGAEDGDRGWQYKVFQIEEENDTTVLLSMLSNDNENGFPGNIRATVRYTLTENNSLRVDYNAETDKPTVICMSNQSYFNLSGNYDNSISDLKLQINASTYMPVDSTRLVTGEFSEVAGTPMDFRKEKFVGRDIDNAWYEQIKNGNGYDHPFVLDTKGDLKKPAVTLRCNKSGIVMQIFTTEPAVQFYTGNFLHSSLSKKREDNYSQRHGLSLETLHFPDSPNHPEWPSVILRPGEKYHSNTIYKFSISK